MEMTPTLWLVRHGVSAGNLAATEAEQTGADRLALDLADADVPLTDDGILQAEALGRRLGSQPHPPERVWVSPYRRAHDTAEIALRTAGLTMGLRVDERLRDRELGVLDLLSSHGVARNHPDEAERRRRQGKFWYRPPGGESWADVALRLRSVLPDIVDGRGPALIVSHDVVVSLLVYICCELSVAELRDLTLRSSVGNTSVTTLTRDSGRWRLDGFADSRHLDRSPAPDTDGEEPNEDVL